jgi:hypothetical protein
MSVTQSNRTGKTLSALKSVSRFQPDISSKNASTLKYNNLNEKYKNGDSKDKSTNFFYDKILNKPERIANNNFSDHIMEPVENKYETENEKVGIVEKNPLPKPTNHTIKKIEANNKSIICWNCENILRVGDDWDMVQCTYCNKVNKISGKDSNNPLNKFDSRINHFESNIPYIFVIVICPYCGEHNKIHKGTQHMICYSCHHSSNVESESSGDKKTKFHSAASTLSSYNSNTIKFSDMMSNQNAIPPSMPISQMMYISSNTPSTSSYISPFNNGIDYYYNLYQYQDPYQLAYYNNYVPNNNFNNHIYNPTKNYLQDYYLRKRLKRINQNPNDRLNCENPYNDKQEINKIKESLNKMNNDLGLGGMNMGMYSNHIKSPLKSNIEGIKDEIENNKLVKNEAIYKSLLMRK